MRSGFLTQVKRPTNLLGALLGGSYSTDEFEGIIDDLQKGLFDAWAAGTLLEGLKPLRCY